MHVFVSLQEIADPFFAYCKQHADRFDRKWKRKNYLALQSYCKVSLQEREKQLTPEAQVPFPQVYFREPSVFTSHQIKRIVERVVSEVRF